ncbi:hypothetical protein [uncultured Tenacibaculum sp.]|uniref:tetratricopeptide repeat protein n=1 Tax=uncultured Tenacibaculum sp. TaxID=174713 RepID=UPI00260C7EBA|nr:hypothetical protein [uncultured Tenacibaculum sp.]
MNNLIKKYELIITDNYELTYSFFEEEINKTKSVYIEIMLVCKYLCDEKIDQAKNIFSKIKLQEVNSPMLKSLLKMSEGLIKSKEGEHNSGIELLKESIDIDTLSQNKWVRLKLYLELKEKTPYEAWGYIEDAIKIDPNFYAALVEKSFGLDPSINHTEIIDLLNKIPSTYKDADCFNLLGVAYLNSESYEKAKLNIEQSINIKKTSDNLFSYANFYHQYEHNLNKAEKLYLESLSLDNSNQDARNSYGWLLFDLNRIEEAEKIFISMLDFSKDQEIFSQIIFFFLMSKNLEKAKLYVNISSKKNDSNYMNDGYFIMIKILEKKEYKKDYTSFKKEYEDYEDKWFREQLTYLLE